MKRCPLSWVRHSANTSEGTLFFPNRASRPANKYVNMYYIYSHRRRTEVITAKQRSWPAPLKSGYLISPFCYVERIVASQSEHRNWRHIFQISKRLYDWSVLLRFVSCLLHSQRRFPSVAVAVLWYFSLLTESLFSLVYWAGTKGGFWYSRKFDIWFFVISSCVV